MSEDFKLSGKLEIIGLDGLDRYVQEMQHKLSNFTNGGSSKVYTEMSKGAKRAKEDTAALNKEILATATSAQDFADKAGLALRRFSAFTVAAGATYGAARLVVSGLKGAAQFERDLVKVKQVTDASSKSLADLQKQISQLGASLGAPAAELIGVAKTLSQAGLSIAQVKTILEGLAQTRLASSFGDIEDTAQGVIAIMGQFKTSAEGVKDALALTNATAGQFAVESEGLISAVKIAGGAFAQASEGIDDANTALAKFYALQTSVVQTTRQSDNTVATGIKTVIARLQRPSTNDFLKDNLGVSVRDSTGQFIGPYAALQKISKALDEVDTKSEKFAKTIEVIGGNRQYGIVVPLLKEAALQNEVLNKSLASQKNFLKEIEIPLTTLSSQFERLSASWTSFSRDVYNSPVFQFLGHQALDLAESLVKVADSIAPIIPLMAVLGGVRLGQTIYNEGVLGVLKTRLVSGKGAPGIDHKAAGGYVGGVGVGDVTPLMAEPGEFVIRKRAAMALGGQVLERLNNADRYAAGGKVKRSSFGTEKAYLKEIDKEVRLVRNPGLSNLLSMLEKHKDVRGLFDPDSKDSYFWNSNDAVHDDIAKSLGLNRKTIDKAAFRHNDPKEFPRYQKYIEGIFNKWQAGEVYGYNTGGLVPLDGRPNPRKLAQFRELDQIRRKLKDDHNINMQKIGKVGLQTSIDRGRSLLFETTAMKQRFEGLDYKPEEELKVILRQGKGITRDFFGRPTDALGIFYQTKIDDKFHMMELAAHRKSNPLPDLKLGTSGSLSGNFSDTYRHEYGHYFDYTKTRASDLARFVEDISPNYIDNKLQADGRRTYHVPPKGYPVSMYAASNHDELFAESFEAFTHPFYNLGFGQTNGRLPDDLHEYFRDILRPRKSNRFATGGNVPGSGHGDKVPIMAEPGEFIIRKAAAAKLGMSTLNKLNHAEKFANGGLIAQKLDVQSYDKNYENLRYKIGDRQFDFTLRTPHDAFGQRSTYNSHIGYIANLTSKGRGGSLKDILPLFLQDFKNLGFTEVDYEASQEPTNRSKGLDNDYGLRAQKARNKYFKSLESYAKSLGFPEKFAAGGHIPGFGSGDKVPIMAEPGEYVIRKAAAAKIGMSTLNKLNHAEKFANGGVVKGYADGGDIKDGLDFRSDKDFNEVRKEFRNLSKNVGMSDKEFANLANEIRLIATSLSEARKLFSGGIKSKQYSGGGIAGLTNAPELANYDQLETILRINAAKKQKVINQKPYSVYNKPNRYIPEDERINTRLQGLPEASSLERILEIKAADNLSKAGARARITANIAATRAGNQASNFGLPDQVEAASNHLTQQREIRARVEANARANRAVNQSSKYGTRLNIFQEEFGVRGRTAADAAEYVANSVLDRPDTTKRKGVNSSQVLRVRGRQTLLEEEFGGGADKFGIRKSRTFDIAGAREDDSSLIGMTSYGAGVNYGSGSGSVGAGAGFSRPGFNLGGTAAGLVSTRYVPARENIPLSVRAVRARRSAINFANSRIGQTLTNPLALGGAAILAQNYLPESKASSALSGGLAGASTGAYFGGAIGSAVGSAVPVLGTALGGAAGTLIGAGVGAVGGAIGAYRGQSASDEEKKSAKALAESSKELEKAFRDLSANGIKNLDKLLRERATLTSKGLDNNYTGSTSFFGNKGSFTEIADGRSVNSAQLENAKTVAESNGELATAAKARIQKLISAGRDKDITGDLLNASISDRPDLLLGNKQGRIYNAITEVLPEQYKKAADDQKIEAAIRTIDTFQSKLAQSVNAIGTFNIKLDEGANDIGNIFNTSQGNFQRNRTFTNQFNNIDGLSAGDIDKELGVLKGQIGRNIDPQISKTLKSFPGVNNFTDILNDEIKKVNTSGGGKGRDTKDIAIGIINDSTGPFKDLPGKLRDQFRDIFEGLDAGKIDDALGGHNKVFDNAIEGIKKGTVEYVKAIKDTANRLYKELQDGGNSLAQLKIQSSTLTVGALNASNAGKELSEQLRGARPDAKLSISRQEAGIGVLTGGTVNPNRILQNIRQLQINRQAIESSNPATAQGVVDKERQLADNTTSLTKNKQALDQLAQSAIGLSAIQNELADLERRRSKTFDQGLNDAFGVGRRERKREERAADIFEKTGGNFRALAQAGLGPQTAIAGINRRREEIDQFGTPKEKEEYEKKIFKISQNSGVRFGNITRKEADRNIANVDNKKIEELRGTVDVAVQRQVEAINAQKALLEDNIKLLDVTLENKFITGISELGKIVDKFPETMKFEGKFEHTVHVTGPNYAGLDRYIRNITEGLVNNAFSRFTEGNYTPPSNGPMQMNDDGSVTPIR